MKKQISLILLALMAPTFTIHLTYLRNYVGGTVYRADGTSVNCAKAKMDIDADGSPRTYHPDGSPPGLDNLSAAGHPGDWWALATDDGTPQGTPIIQGPDDPAPGFYVSMTAINDPNYSYKSPNCYANAQEIPYIVIPNASSDLQWRVGDFCTACYKGTCTHGIVADTGPRQNFGEASMKMANTLGIDDNPKSGGIDGGVKYLVYKGSGRLAPQPIPTFEQIQEIGQELFQKNQGQDILDALDNHDDIIM